MNNLTINESKYKLENGEYGKIAVFIYSGLGDPAAHLRIAIKHYVQGNGYNDFMDANMNNPWTRVIISDINGMKQEKFNPEKHRMVNNRKLKLERILNG